jgi:hypothetical protein
LFQTSFQVGGAVVLAVVTAVVEASGGGRVISPTATLAAYRPALVLITGVAAVGMLVALTGLRSRQDLAADQAGELDVGAAAVSPGGAAAAEVVPVAAEVVPRREFAKDGRSA